MSARILIVEDSRIMRQMVRTALEPDGYDLHERENGQQGLDAIATVAPELVITDVNMPQMDGLSLVRAIRTLAPFRFTPVLVLTTESGDDMKQAGRAAGATGWVVKPFDPEQLREVVARVLGARVGRR
jgi:two-component system chemotaxis response regulator CheY